jgi:SCP-2 sterol transfer family protein
MPDLDLSNISSLDSATFASMIKSASKDELSAAIEGAGRTKILDEIFQRFPQQFQPDRAGSTSAVVHWTITGGPNGSDTYELVIADGGCTLSPTATAEPRLAVTTGGVEFLQLVSGNANPMTMFMTGKLKAKGDLGLAANLGNIFGLARA